jgi:hypothetical protein
METGQAQDTGSADPVRVEETGQRIEPDATAGATIHCEAGAPELQEVYRAARITGVKTIWRALSLHAMAAGANKNGLLPHGFHQFIDSRLHGRREASHNASHIPFLN